MSSLLRARFALILLLATFLIPIGVSGLRGLTHVLSCSSSVATPFTITILPDGVPTITSSRTLTRDDDSSLCAIPDPSSGIEEGLVVDLAARGTSGKIEMIVIITNQTHRPWQGTVQLNLGGQRRLSYPVTIGRIPARQVRRATVLLELPKGLTDIDGKLLIGP